MNKSSRHRQPNPSVTPPFPLFKHARGYWAKKVLGKLVYFGKVVDDPDGTAALAKWESQKADLLAGRVPSEKRDCLTVARLVDEFLTAKASRRESGEIGARTFRQYFKCCEAVLKYLGPNRAVDDLAPADFERLRAQLAKGRGPVALGNEITLARMLFLYAYGGGLTERPVQFGQGFAKPSRKTLRRARAEKGPRMFSAAELRRILDAAKGPLKAMILLGVNCGYGQTDLSELREHRIDWEHGWIHYPRPKTGIPRSCPLWPETIAALREAIDQRPTAKDPQDSDRVFLTVFGRPWVRDNREKVIAGEAIGTTPNDAIAKEFSKLLGELGLKRPGLGFYALRHTTETVGGDACDQVAVDAIMGHVDDTMAANYREAVFAPRLQAVADHIHRWLFGDGSAPKKGKRRAPARKRSAAPPGAPNVDVGRDASRGATREVSAGERPALRLFVG